MSEFHSPAISPWSQRFVSAILPALFLLLGVVYATWAARIPAIRDGLQLNPAQLGTALLSGGIGAVTSFPLIATLIGRYGARRAAGIAGTALLCSLPCIALAPQLAWLLAATFLLGAASSSFDVAINALGSEAERVAGRSIMALLHAWFCVGTVSGALLGSLLAGMAVTPLLHFSGTAIALSVLLGAAMLALPPDRPDPESGKKAFALLHGPLLALGLIGFFGAMVEGSVADWSGVFMKDQLNAGEGIAPLAFAAFSALMLSARLVGDRLKDRFGARRVVALGALLAAGGIGIATLALGIPLTITGFAMAGAGLAALFPFVFSAAGRHGSTALAGVATLSYSGSLLGPPIIGFLAQGWGLRAALVFISVMAVAIAMAAAKARWLE